MRVCSNGSRFIVYFMILYFFGKYTDALNIDAVDLSEKCGEVESMAGKAAIRVYADSSSFERTDYHCTYTLTADPGNHLMVRFRDMRMATKGSCHSDWLSLHDGSSIASRPLVTYSVCGRTYYSAQYTTLRTDATLYFKGRPGLSRAKFSAVITQYHFGQCDSGEITCANHRCIAESLWCKGHNPCGDYSDCFLTVEVRNIARFIAGLAVCPTIVIVLMVVVRRRRRRNLMLSRNGRV